MDNQHEIRQVQSRLSGELGDKLVLSIAETPSSSRTTTWGRVFLRGRGRIGRTEKVVSEEDMMSTDDASESLSSDESKSESDVPEDGENSGSSCISVSWSPSAMCVLPESD